MSKFKPDMYYKDIFDVNYKLLKEKGIKVLIFDLDNTIIGADEEIPSDEVTSLFKKLVNDFVVFIASNNVKERVRKIGKHLGVHSFYSVIKPTKRIKKLLLNKYDVPMEEVAIIGDQIITDIFMGHRLNMHTILVDPMGKDMKVTYLNRFLEDKLMKRIKVQRGDYYDKTL